MSKKADLPAIPLPDPEVVEERVTAAIRKVKERKAFYATCALLVTLAVIAVLVIANLGTAQGAGAFSPLAQRYDVVKKRLARALSAREALAELDAHIQKLRGEPEEGLGLWLGAIGHYRESWVGDKQTFDDRRPNLEKALAYLQELRGEKFDDLILAKTKWLTGAGAAPIERLLRQVEADLAWAKANSIAPPAPSEEPTAVLRTELGDIHLRFYSDLAPKHVEMFLTLAAQGTYNGTAFHFVSGGNDAPDAVMAGDPFSFFYNEPLRKEHILRWGSGGIGVGLAPESSRFKINHIRGIVSSQRTEKADWDNGMQFQILTSTVRRLDRIHTPFAMVIEGMDVVDRIAKRKTASTHPTYRDDSAFQSVVSRDLLVEPVIIHKVIIYRGRKAAEHTFGLEEGEKSLDTLAGTAARAIPESQIYGERKMISVEQAEAPRLGLDIPFPADADLEKANPLGERRDPTGGSASPPPGGG